MQKTYSEKESTKRTNEEHAPEESRFSELLRDNWPVFLGIAGVSLVAIGAYFQHKKNHTRADRRAYDLFDQMQGASPDEYDTAYLAPANLRVREEAETDDITSKLAQFPEEITGIITNVRSLPSGYVGVIQNKSAISSFYLCSDYFSDPAQESKVTHMLDHSYVHASPVTLHIAASEDMNQHGRKLLIADRISATVNGKQVSAGINSDEIY